MTEQTANLVADLVGRVGFPIVAFFAAGCLLVYVIKTHKEEVKRMSDSLDANTKVIQALLDRFDK